VTIKDRILDWIKEQRDWVLTQQVAKAVKVSRATVIKYLQQLYGEGLIEWRKVGRANMWRPTRAALLGKTEIRARKTGVLTCPYCGAETPDWDVLNLIYKCPRCGARYTYSYRDQVAETVADLLDLSGPEDLQRAREEGWYKVVELGEDLIAVFLSCHAYSAK